MQNMGTEQADDRFGFISFDDEEFNTCFITSQTRRGGELTNGLKIQLC
jgi:hypothetical protein